VLRPLQSKNARHIYLVLRDAHREYLTTYDIQPILEEQKNKLSKVELNNWLSTLQDAGLVQKAPERGKPTTKPYDRRYTFDLWKLSKKGRKTARSLEVLMGNTPIQTIEKVVPTTNKKKIETSPDLEDTNFEDLEKIRVLFIHLSLLKALHKKYEADLFSLSKETGINAQMILELIEDQEKSNMLPLYNLKEIPLDLPGKIRQKLGLSTKKNYKISLTPYGVEFSSYLSP